MNSRPMLAFAEFIDAVVTETGHPPKEIVLPLASFEILAKALGPECRYVCAPGETLGITLETAHGPVEVTHARRLG